MGRMLGQRHGMDDEAWRFLLRLDVRLAVGRRVDSKSPFCGEQLLR
jgi:hypothetical protein